jgi:hypothetical protein
MAICITDIAKQHFQMLIKEAVATAATKKLTLEDVRGIAFFDME